MKKISLTQGKFAVVNDVDYTFLMQWKWYFHAGYAVRSSRKSDGLTKRKLISMHQVVLIRKLGYSDFEETDHKNINGLDNRRGNLRPASRSQNNKNRRIQQRGSSKFKGVHRRKDCKRWQAKIQFEGQTKHIGLFIDEIEAAKAYNKAASEHFGKFACLNPV